MIQIGRPSLATLPVRWPVVISASAMTPIVFCASLVPCDSATSEAVAIWPQRKPSSRRFFMTFCVIRYTSHVPQAATTPAMTGAATAGISTFWVTPAQLTPLLPSAARPAPIRPPNRACDELDGMPNSQVSRFHRMPPIRPAKMMVRPVDALIPGSNWPVLLFWTLSTEVVTVTATSTERNAPTRFRTPASRTAVLGLRAPVAIDVAIALPVSWNPLVKSKASAVTISSTRMIMVVLMALILRVGKPI